MSKINKFDLLVSVYIFCLVAAELMGAKTFHLFNIGSFSLNASVAIFLMPLLFTINDVITEVHGKERATSVIKSGLIIICLLIAFSLLAISLSPSSRFASSESAYKLVFGVSIRISLASLAAFIASEFMDVKIFVKIRQKFGKKALWFRNNASNIIAQFFDTAVFYILAFYAIDKSFSSNILFLFGLILPYWLLKCSISIIETPLVYAGVSWLKKDNENKDR